MVLGMDKLQAGMGLIGLEIWGVWLGKYELGELEYRQDHGM